PVVPTLWQRGEALAASVTEAIAQTGLESVITLGGLPPWTVLTFKDHPKASAEAVKTLFVREMLKAGVLINSSHNVCYSLSESDLNVVSDGYAHALAKISEEIELGDMESRLGPSMVQPIFSLR
ncbi:MAG: hypothetical protein OXC93_04515, partial [Rhodospirillaceae bacterium]|nr:hypothetical protein [Rhodospirillaceae bacterium]